MEGVTWQDRRRVSDIVLTGGTVSLSGVYGGMADPMPMMTLFEPSSTPIQP
jgi:hypothetical protein